MRPPQPDPLSLLVDAINGWSLTLAIEIILEEVSREQIPGAMRRCTPSGTDGNRVTSEEPRHLQSSSDRLGIHFGTDAHRTLHQHQYPSGLSEDGTEMYALAGHQSLLAQVLFL